MKNSNFARRKGKKLITKVISAGCLPFTLSGRSRGETVFSPGGEGEQANAGMEAGLRRRIAKGSLDYGGGAWRWSEVITGGKGQGARSFQKERRTPPPPVRAKHARRTKDARRAKKTLGASFFLLLGWATSQMEHVAVNGACAPFR